MSKRGRPISVNLEEMLGFRIRNYSDLKEENFERITLNSEIVGSAAVFMFNSDTKRQRYQVLKMLRRNTGNIKHIFLQHRFINEPAFHHSAEVRECLDVPETRSISTNVAEDVSRTPDKVDNINVISSNPLETFEPPSLLIAPITGDSALADVATTPSPSPRSSPHGLTPVKESSTFSQKKTAI